MDKHKIEFEYFDTSSGDKVTHTYVSNQGHSKPEDLSGLIRRTLKYEYDNKHRIEKIKVNGKPIFSRKKDDWAAIDNISRLNKLWELVDNRKATVYVRLFWVKPDKKRYLIYDDNCNILNPTEARTDNRFTEYDEGYTSIYDAISEFNCYSSRCVNYLSVIDYDIIALDSFAFEVPNATYYWNWDDFKKFKGFEKNLK